MRRLLLLLPIALIISIAVAPQLLVSADYVPHGTQYAGAYQPTVSGPQGILPAFSAADNGTSVPEGLTLTKGVPFIQPLEVEKGQVVTIKVKATNDSFTQITYPNPLKVNGKGAGSPTSITLQPGESKDITFLLTAEVTGSNDITVGNLQGIVTVKGGSLFDMFPLYVWIIFGVIIVILGMLLALMVIKPKKKPGALPGQSPRQGKQPGKGGKPGSPDSFQQPGGFPRQGMPDGMQPGMPGQGQPGSPYDMQGQGMMGMQQPFQQQQGMQQPFQQPGPQGMNQPFPQQPGMPPPFPQQQPGMSQQFPPPPGAPPSFQQQSQPGMPPPFPSQQQGGMPPSPMRGPQYPPAPHMPQAGQQPPHGMPPGMPQPMGQGMPHAPLGAPAGQPPFGMQQPPVQMPPQGGMPPPMQPPMQPGMYPPAPVGMPPQMQGYQSMGMPKFSVSSLSITPNSVKVGEPVNISIYVTNNGMQTGKYSVVLRIGGVVENISDMTLSPGANQTASFVVVKDAPGDYYADIDGLGGFFNVIPLNPPAFIVSNFSISPERVRQGQAISITASVTNTGEITGSHALILRVKGMAEAQKEVLLGPGKTEDVEFQVSKDTPGFYPVSVENWTGKFVVEMDWNG